MQKLSHLEFQELGDLAKSNGFAKLWAQLVDPSNYKKTSGRINISEMARKMKISDITLRKRMAEFKAILWDYDPFRP